MKYISIDYLLRMFPEDSFLIKLIKEKIDKARESDYIIVDDESCNGCSKLIDYNDGHVECIDGLEPICITNDYLYKSTKDK